MSSGRRLRRINEKDYNIMKSNEQNCVSQFTEKNEAYDTNCQNMSLIQPQNRLNMD